MKDYAAAHKLMDRRPGTGKTVDKYYSVEFAFCGLGVIYQYKIWNIDPTAMCVLVKEHSRILPWLKVGSKLNTKYYSTDFKCPIENLDTEIQYIIKQDQGRFRGHFLVGFEIEECQDKNKIHWPYFSDKAQVLPFHKPKMGI